MASDPVREALRAAAEAARQSLRGPDTCTRGEVCELPICPCATDSAAAAVAAFLRALPPGWHMDQPREMIAAAVERAAREAG